MKKLVPALLLLSVSAFAADSLKVELSLDHPDGMYKSGEPVALTMRLTENGKPASNRKLAVTVFNNAKKEKSEVRETVDGKIILRETPANAGAWKIQAMPLGKDGKPAQRYPAVAGFMVDADKIKIPAAGRPADFNAWWDGELAKMRAIPMEVVRREWKWGAGMQQRIKERAWLRESIANTNNYDVRVRCVGEQWVAGGLSIPKKPGKYPALIQFFGVGFTGGGPNPHASNTSKLIVFTVNAHGLKKDETWEKDYPGYEKRLTMRYPTIGFGKGREHWYYHDCFLRAARAVQYVKSLPEWDGKTLIVRGGSQGAAQSMAAAALEPGVSHCILAIPAMCDYTGKLNTPPRNPAWPVLLQPNRTNPAEAGYYDCVNFAPRVKAKRVTVICGLVDHYVAPTGPIAFLNALPNNVQKKLITLPFSGHSGGATYQYEEIAQKEAIASGK